MVEVLLLSTLKDLVGKSSTRFDGPIMIHEIILDLGLQDETVITALNHEICDRDTTAHPGDIVALMPLFSGG
ncbi:MAG: MoaD/ThiS family protein [Candidatus Altiarchaeota archaeon]|nr:MoaD/ThiS family protein [Candidatus Altiarchaeota archaeon]